MLRLWITTRGNDDSKWLAANPFRGILREEFLLPLGLSVNALAKALHVPATRVHEIVKENRSITPDTALRLARYFGGDAKSWLNLQTDYDLKIVAKDSSIEAEVSPREAA